MGLFSSLFGGGGDSSSTSTSTTTNNADRRFVVDTGSVGVSAEGSTVNVSSTDLGAVRSAIDLADVSTRTAAATMLGALGMAADSLAFGKSEATKAAEAASDSILDRVKDIEPKQWALAGLAVLGLWFVMRKG